MDKTEKIVVVLGVGFAALMLAQAAFRTGTAPMPSEWNKTAQKLAESDKEDASIKTFGDAVGLDWYAINKVISEDSALFRAGAQASGDEANPGVSANIGGLEGRPYTIVDNEAWLMGGR